MGNNDTLKRSLEDAIARTKARTPLAVEPVNSESKEIKTYDDLLARCDLSLPLDPEEIEFMNTPPVGREEI